MARRVLKAVQIYTADGSRRLHIRESRLLFIICFAITSGGELGKMTGKIDSKVRLLCKTETDGSSDKFSETKQRPVNNY
jgi:hypothetical protein